MIEKNFKDEKSQSDFLSWTKSLKSKKLIKVSYDQVLKVALFSFANFFDKIYVWKNDTASQIYIDRPSRLMFYVVLTKIDCSIQKFKVDQFWIS